MKIHTLYSNQSFSVLKYTLSSMFTLFYNILCEDEQKKLEKVNPVFDEEAEQIDENGYLYQYFLESKDGTGYTIGLENTSKYKIIITGMASKTWSESVNRRIAQQRAENAKKILIEKYWIED